MYQSHAILAEQAEESGLNKKLNGYFYLFLCFNSNAVGSFKMTSTKIVIVLNSHENIPTMERLNFFIFYLGNFRNFVRHIFLRFEE